MMCAYEEAQRETRREPDYDATRGFAARTQFYSAFFHLPVLLYWLPGVGDCQHTDADRIAADSVLFLPRGRALCMTSARRFVHKAAHA